MAHQLRIVMAQLNLTVGDIAGNLEKHIEAANIARKEYAADLIVFPELSLIAYPCEDLLLRKSFIDATQSALKTLSEAVKDIYCLVGHPYASSQGLFNCASLIYNGKIILRHAKQCLPNYGVFDEYRYFVPGNLANGIFMINEIPMSVIICEDAWNKAPIQRAAEQGASLIVVINASPFESRKHEQRLAMLNKRAAHNHVPIVYVNQIGGQDDLIFDGGSMAIDADGKLNHFAGFFQEKLYPIDCIYHDQQVTIVKKPKEVDAIEPLNNPARIYQGLVLAVQDYVKKNHFPSVILGVSGGIDSALTLALAVDALGKDAVHAVFMPSPYTAAVSEIDALALTRNLHVSLQTFSIESIYQHFLASLASSFKDKKFDVTEENIQARVRAVLLMALSNKHGHLVLTTGNRSELAVGYCTLYGDMAGGFAVLKDVPKTMVYELARYRNELSLVIPNSILERAPSAELAPNQKDEDSLPPYSLLDEILYLYLNEQCGIDEIVAKGFEQTLVSKIVDLIHKNEYKRRQAAIGPRINHQAFGRDRRYPVTSGFKG